MGADSTRLDHPGDREFVLVFLRATFSSSNLIPVQVPLSLFPFVFEMIQLTRCERLCNSLKAIRKHLLPVACQVDGAMLDQQQMNGIAKHSLTTSATATIIAGPPIKNHWARSIAERDSRAFSHFLHTLSSASRLSTTMILRHPN